MFRIVFTGAESTGKTTIARYIANHYKLPLVEEFSREYLAGRESYEYDDLLKIANGQLSSEYEITNLNPRILICDTDIITIKIWAVYQFGKCHKWIEEQLEKIGSGHYFLCAPDIPWAYDRLRENPNDRDELNCLYQEELSKLNLNYSIITGSIEQRAIQVVKTIEKEMPHSLVYNSK